PVTSTFIALPVRIEVGGEESKDFASPRAGGRPANRCSLARSPTVGSRSCEQHPPLGRLKSGIEWPARGHRLGFAPSSLDLRRRSGWPSACSSHHLQLPNKREP